MLCEMGLVVAIAAPGVLKIWGYVAFIALVLFFLALDLGVFHRVAHEVSLREAIWWSVVWFVVGVGFAVNVYYAYEHHWLGFGLNTPMYAVHEHAHEGGHSLITVGEVRGFEAGKQYLVGYVLERALAMDNIFVIALVFAYFGIPGRYQHRVLFWGIVGALVTRGAMIFIGGEMIQRYQWILIVFGVFLVVTALKMAFAKEVPDAGRNIVVRLVTRFLPVTEFFDGQRFFTRRTSPPPEEGAVEGHDAAAPAEHGERRRWPAATPLLLALVVVEIIDVVFAVDSIPAVFAITPDPFVVFTSNIFAILGLRALYFCLAALIARFWLIKPALMLVLAFVGVKLLLFAGPPYLSAIGLPAARPIEIDTTVSLIVVIGTLVLATLLSSVVPQSARRTAAGG